MTDIQAHWETLANQPGETAALEAVTAAFSSEGRWEELLRIYEDNALRADPSLAPQLLRRAADLCVHELASAPRAEAYLARAIEVAPADLESHRALRAIYMSRGDYERGVEVYEKELARTTDARARASGLVEVAEIFRAKLRRDDKALGALRQAQRADKSFARIYQSMAAIYEVQGRLEQAQTALLTEIEIGGPRDDVLARLAALAQRLLERPRLHELVGAAVDAILAARPDDERALAIQSSLASFRSEWASRVAQLVQDAAAAQKTDKERAAELWLAVAELQLVYGNDADAALMSLDKSVAAKPGHGGALRLMEEIYGAQDRYEDLALKLEMMAAYAREPGVAVELYLKAAMHYTVRLDNPEASAGIHQRVLQLDPSNKVSSNALAEYFRERQQWEEALAVLAAWADRATNAADKVAAHYACTRILEEEVGDKGRARHHYVAILELDPENQAAARALEAVYRESGNHEELARTLHAKLAGAQGAERVAILSELGDLFGGPLDQPDRALEAYGELYRLEPGAELREKLEELGARAGAFAELVQILESGLDTIQETADKIQAMHSLAALYESARQAPLEALRMHRRILAMAPNDPRARDSLGRLMAAAAESGDKVQFYREQADAAGSPAEKVTTLLKLAHELVEHARDYVRAIDVYREILKLDPEHDGALEGLLGLYRRDNRWGEVVEVLLAKVERLHGDQRVAVQIELGQILEQRLGEVDRAADWYMAVLAEVSDRQEAIDGLERLLSRAKRVVPIAEFLQPRYLAAEQWHRAASMIEIRVKGTEEPATRAELLRNLAGIHEHKLQAPVEALNALLRAFQADPSDAGLQVELERIAGKAHDFAGVVRAYRAATSSLEGEDKTRLRIRAAALAEKCADLTGAAADFLKVVGLAEITDQTAIDGLKRLLAAGIDGAKIAEAAKQIGASLDDPQRTAFWRKLARFYERDMNDSNNATAAWREVLANHDKDPEASAELDRLYSSGAEPAELVEHLRAKLDVAADDVSKAALGGQIAAVMADRLHDLDGAIAELARVAELVPGQRLVWQRLYDLHMRQGNPQEAAQAMHKELGLLPEGEDRRERLVVYADLVGKQLGDMNTALQALRGVVTVDAKDERAAALLEEYRSSAGDPALQAEILDMLQACTVALERWPEAVAVIGARVDAAVEPAERVELLKACAAIKADKQGDAAGAYTDLERAFRDAPLDAELRDRLERVAEASGAWEQLAQALQAAVGAIDDPEAQKPLRRKLAEILDSRLGRGAEAIEHMQAATGGALPESLSDLEAMERLLREQNRTGELAEVLYAMVARLPADQTERKQTTLLELAGLCESTLLDKQRAVETYRALLEIDARDERALRPVEELLAELDRPGERADILERLVAKGAQNPSLVDDLIKLAAVQIQLGHHDEAVKHFRAVLLKRREHPEAIDGLEGLLARVDNKLEIAQILEPIYTAKQDHEKLATVLEARLEATTDKVQRKGLLRRIGDIYENRLGQKERAFAMARRSLHEDPADMGVRMWIEKLSGETGALAELADAYVEEAREAEPQLSLQFHRRAAAIYHEKLNDVGSAVREYEAILVIEQRDEKALTGLENIHRTTESWAQLIELLRKRLEMTAGLERKREYLSEIASLQAEKLGDFPAAVGSFQEILALTPDDTVAFGQIEQLLAQTGNWEQLAQVYDGEVKRLAEKRGRDVVARRLEYQYRRGRVLDEQFGDRERAAEIFEAILGESPNHGSTLQYLEARAQQGVLEAIQILEGVYQRDNAWQKYVQLLEVKLNNTAATEQRKPIYVSLAEAFDQQLKVGDMAFQALSRAHQEDRTDREIIERLEELAGRTNA